MSTIITELRRMADGIPDGGSVVLPAEWLRRRLADAPEDAPGEEIGVAEVAEAFGRSESTVREWFREGLVPGAYKLRGSEWRAPADAIQKMRAAERQPKSPAREAIDAAPTEDLRAWRRQ
jgi:hypothetical protein